MANIRECRSFVTANQSTNPYKKLILDFGFCEFPGPVDEFLTFLSALNSL